jgi:hypothetical protein
MKNFLQFFIIAVFHSINNIYIVAEFEENRPRIRIEIAGPLILILTRGFKKAIET